MPVTIASEQIATQEDVLQELLQEVPEATRQEVEEIIAAAAALEGVLAVSPDTIQMANKVYQEVVNDAKQAKRIKLKLATLVAARFAKRAILTFGG